MRISDVLRQAAGEVRKGWCRFVLEDDDRNVCANGALARVCLGRATRWSTGHRHYATLRAAQHALGDVLGERDAPAFAIPLWNNAADQTQENVATTLEYAALMWDQQQAAALGHLPKSTGLPAGSVPVSCD